LNDARQAFAFTLRTHREQLGIPLSDIAESTKISVALLSGLERGDVSRWPKGIFRRSFFREYAVAIGLSPDPLFADFVRLFPDDHLAVLVAEQPSELRLQLAATDTAWAVAMKRTALVIAELGVVAFTGLAGGWMLAVDILPAIGVAALVYYPVMNLCVERRPIIGSVRALTRSPQPPVHVESPEYSEMEQHVRMVQPAN
jgi:hypothetical protein